MGCTLLTAFVYLCVLFSGTLVHLVATLTGYVDILLNRTVFLESTGKSVLITSRIYTLPSLCSQRRWDGSNL